MGFRKANAPCVECVDSSSSYHHHFYFRLLRFNKIELSSSFPCLQMYRFIMLNPNICSILLQFSSKMMHFYNLFLQKDKIMGCAADCFAHPCFFMCAIFKAQYAGVLKVNGTRMQHPRDGYSALAPKTVRGDTPFRYVPSLSTPAGGRTLDTLIKSQVLYQLSYKRILCYFASAKVRLLFCSAKLFGFFL